MPLSCDDMCTQKSSHFLFHKDLGQNIAAFVCAPIQLSTLRYCQINKQGENTQKRTDAYSRVHISSDKTFFKILKEPSIVQK